MKTLSTTKIISLLLLVSISLTIFAIPASSVIAASDVISVNINNPLELNFVKANINSLIKFNELPGTGRRHSGFANKTISNVKQLTDFNGYMYYIVEFYPSGYIIYDNQFTTVLELSAEADSPYLNYNYNLIYGGAMNYYIQSNPRLQKGDYTFTHTVLGTEMVVNNDEYQLLKEESLNISAAVEKSIDAALSRSTHNSQSQTSSSVTHTFEYIKNYSTITNLDTEGWNTDGRCGWVAAAIVVWYYKVENGWSEFAPNGWDVSLVTDIQGYRDNATWGHDLQSALDAYSYGHGADYIWPNALPALCELLPTPSAIWSLMEDDVPVILLGKFPKYYIDGSTEKMDHAVTVNGMEKYEYSKYDIEWGYWAHLGWYMPKNPGDDNFNDYYINDDVITKGAIVYYY